MELFFDDLKENGLKGVGIVISCAHKGIQEPVTGSFLSAALNYCHVHFMRLISGKKPSHVMETMKQDLENGFSVSTA